MMVHNSPQVRNVSFGKDNLHDFPLCNQDLKRTDESFEDEEQQQRIPHLMMTDSSNDDDEAVYDDYDDQFRDISPMIKFVETSSTSPSLKKKPRPISFRSRSDGASSSSLEYLSLPPFPRQRHRRDVSLPTLRPSHGDNHIHNKSQHIHRTTHAHEHFVIKNEPELELKLQRSWHGGYDYAYCSLKHQHTRKKKHKRCHSFNDAFVEPFPYEQEMGRNNHVDHDSFNNLEEIFYNRYKNHHHHPASSCPSSPVSVPYEHRLQSDNSHPYHFSRTQPLVRSQRDLPNEEFSITLEESETIPSSPASSYCRNNTSHLRPIMEPEESEPVRMQNNCSADITDIHEETDLSRDVRLLYFQKPLDGMAKSSKHQMSFNHHPESPPMSPISDITSPTTTLRPKSYFRQDSPDFFSSTMETETTCDSSYSWNITESVNNGLSDIHAPYSPETKKRGWKTKVSKMLWIRPKREYLF